MPRSSRSRPAPAPAPHTRGAHTAAMPAPSAGRSLAPAPHPPAPAVAAAAPAAPGMLAQMAATAGSVAVGSTIGHGISSMLFGGGGGGGGVSAPAPVEPAEQRALQSGGASCDVRAKEFTQCLERADLQSCSWYLEQLKACQAAAAPY